MNWSGSRQERERERDGGREGEREERKEGWEGEKERRDGAVGQAKWIAA